MASVPLWLYTTAGCHLCERLEATLLAWGAQMSLTHVEIAFDALLIERYATRIPVLATASGAEFSLLNSLSEEEVVADPLIDWLMAQGIEVSAPMASPSHSREGSSREDSSAGVSMRDGRRFLR